MLTNPPEKSGEGRKEMVMSRGDGPESALEAARDCAPVLNTTVARAMSLILELAEKPELEEAVSANVNPVQVREIA